MHVLEHVLQRKHEGYYKNGDKVKPVAKRLWAMSLAIFFILFFPGVGVVGEWRSWSIENDRSDRYYHRYYHGLICYQGIVNGDDMKNLPKQEKILCHSCKVFDKI